MKEEILCKQNTSIQIDCISISSTEEENIKPKNLNVVKKKNVRKSLATPKPKPLTAKQLRTLKVKKEYSASKISQFFAPLPSTSTKKINPNPIFYYEKKVPYSKTGEKIRHECPAYKIIQGTTFAVDSFRFGIIDGITHYFLTHFHADHYGGLTKRFDKPIYLSALTGRLVKRMINVDASYIKIIPLNEPFIINDVEITAVDANHCPGAVMFFFKLPNNKTILHTGDFRACPEMESLPIFWNYDLDIIYLDTTYLSSKYEFISQWNSIKKAQEYVYEYGNKFNWENFLIICGSYLIGKEKIWINIAEYFKLKVWMDKNRKKAIECFDNKQILNYLIDNPKEAKIHVLPVNKLHYNWLLDYLNSFEEFEHILALVPSGWQKNSKPIVRGHITIIGIEYSEHSGYDELKRFIRYVRPKEAISTVAVSGKDLSKTGKIPSDWLEYGTPKSKKFGYQKSITNFITVTPRCIFPDNIEEEKLEADTTPTNENNNSYENDSNSSDVIIQEQDIECIIVSENEDSFKSESDKNSNDDTEEYNI